MTPDTFEGAAERKPLRVAFDCDGTLWIPEPYGMGGKPNVNVVALFHLLDQLGCHLIVWSGGGEKWAAEVSDLCCIKPDEIRDKPPLGEKAPDVDLAIDDCEDLGTVTLFIRSE